MRFAWGSPDMNTPVGNLIDEVLLRHALGNPFARDLAGLRLQFLAQDLQRIESARPDLLRQYRKRIRKAGSNRGHFFGIRFEVKMASMLIKNNLTFTTPDPPDFAIQKDGLECFIECGSSRLKEGKQGDLSYKVTQEIRSKSAKPYANLDTALAIDITNLRFHGMTMQTLAAASEFKVIVAQELATARLGSVLLYSYFWDQPTNRYLATYMRQDAESISSTLVKVLDTLAPSGELLVTVRGLTREG